MEFKSKHEYLRHEIRNMIQENKLKPGDKLMTESEFQKLYNVSRHTVRQALNYLENEGIIYKEQGLGSFVAEPKAKKKIKEIGVITTFISDYIFPYIIQGIEEELTKAGYSMILTSTNNNIDLEKKALEIMIDRPIDGLVVEPTKSSYYNPNLGLYLKLKEKGIPIIMINAKYEELDVPQVVLNDYKASFDLTKHLVEQNHTKVGGIFKADDRQGKERLKGFIHACYKFGIELLSDNVFVYETGNLDNVLKEVEEKMIRDKKVTGIVCYNDKVATDLLRIIWKSNYKVPDDFSIVSHDNSNLSTISEVRITGIDHPKNKLGKKAAQTLLNYIENKSGTMETTVFDGELILYDSVKRIEELNGEE